MNIVTIYVMAFFRSVVWRSIEYIFAMNSYDVESVVTGFGSYDWEQTHAPATQTAVAIDSVIKAGAVSTGKQTMDDFGLR